MSFLLALSLSSPLSVISVLLAREVASSITSSLFFSPVSFLLFSTAPSISTWSGVGVICSGIPIILSLSLFIAKYGLDTGESIISGLVVIWIYSPCSDQCDLDRGFIYLW